MPTSKIKFTKLSIASLPEASSGRDTYYDTKTSGLLLRVTTAGTKTFSFRRKLNGRAIRVTLGKFPGMTVEQAQQKAIELNGDVVKGINPSDLKKEKRDEMTFSELEDTYIERHAKLHKKTWEEDQRMYTKHLSHWSNRKLSEIQRKDVQRLHTKIGQKAPYAANRVLALLQTMFNRAADWGYNKPNPAKGIKKFKEKSRERFLEADELPRFFKSLAEEPNHTARDYFLIGLLTGARRANCQEMKWSEINFDRTVWDIPETKNGTSQTIPLVQAALDVLNARKELPDKDNTWVFPGKGKTGHLVEPKKAWKRIMDRADIKDARIHDLRRSLGSWQASTGANLSIIGKTLNHKNVATTAIYARLSLDPVRESMNIATDAMLAAASASNGQGTNGEE
jgi:integrase